VSKLTEKQKRFADEYLIDLNATQAATRAGYSEKTARSMGQRLLTNVDIEKYIQERISKREKRTEITQDRVLEELAKIGFAKITDFISYRDELRHVGFTQEGDPIERSVFVMDIIDSDNVDGAVIQEVSVSREGNFKFKLHDKLNALEKLGKHLGLYEGEDKTGEVIVIRDNIKRNNL